MGPHGPQNAAMAPLVFEIVNRQQLCGNSWVVAILAKHRQWWDTTSAREVPPAVIGKLFHRHQLKFSQSYDTWHKLIVEALSTRLFPFVNVATIGHIEVIHCHKFPFFPKDQ